MHSAKRYSRLAIAGIAATALVTGCGSSSAGEVSSSVLPSRGASTSGAGANPHALLAASVGKTEAAKNAKLHMEIRTSVAGKSLGFAGDGVIDFAGKQFQLSITMPAAAGISGTIEERVVGKDLYLKLPKAATSATGGKPWVKLDTSKLGASSPDSLGSVGEDPTQFLGTLRSVSDSIIKVGTEDIRGVKTTHYRAQIDLSKAAAASGADTSSLGQLEPQLGSSTLPEDVYIDDNGLARRFSVSITPAAGSSTGSSSGGSSTSTTGAVSITVDLYDFGGTDTSGIVAPPAGEVASLPASLGGGVFG
jgi:hypothetical protein